MRYAGLCLVLAGTTAVSAQEPPRPPHVIQVVGMGRVSTMPDLAVIDYWAAGEGKTPDEASGMLAASQKAINNGVSRLFRGAAQITNSNLVVIAVRGPDCQGTNGYNAQPRLNEGACAIKGYLATMQGTIRTPQIEKAGTAVALASQLGARDARLQTFQLTNSPAAYGAAIGAAIADARRQAATMARAAGEKLGPIIAMRDQNFRPAEEIVVSGMDTVSVSAPAAPRVPVAIDVNPRPIDTTAQVYVTFAIAS